MNSKTISVIRHAHFNAAHRLNNVNWTDEENKTFYGLCNNPNFHGHNYEMEIKITGILNEETGYLLDLKDLNNIIENKVCKAFDHKNLNLDTEEFRNLNPTAENIAIVIYNKIKQDIDPNFSLQVKLYETPRNCVEYNG